MKPTKPNCSWILLVLSVALTACGPDRTVEDWRREKVSEELSAIRAISGQYGGNLVSNSRGGLGSVSLEVWPDTLVSGSSGSRSTEPQASLRGKLTLLLEGKTRMVAFRGGFYDRSTGDFKAEIPVSSRSSLSTTLDLEGTFSEGRVRGRIGSDIFPESEARFDLERGVGLPEESRLGSGKSSAQAQDEVAQRFSGTAEFVSSAPAPMDFTLLTPQNSSEGDFLDLFVAIKWVDVTLMLNGRSPVHFKGSQWDQRTGILTGEIQGEAGTQRDRYVLMLRCTQIGAGQTPSGWDCTYWSSQIGLVFKAKFSASKTEKKDVP